MNPYRDPGQVNPRPLPDDPHARWLLENAGWAYSAMEWDEKVKRPVTVRWTVDDRHYHLDARAAASGTWWASMHTPEAATFTQGRHMPITVTLTDGRSVWFVTDTTGTISGLVDAVVLRAPLPPAITGMGVRLALARSIETVMAAAMTSVMIVQAQDR